MCRLVKGRSCVLNKRFHPTFLNVFPNKIASLEILSFKNELFQHNMTPNFHSSTNIKLKMTVSCLELCNTPCIFNELLKL